MSDLSSVHLPNVRAPLSALDSSNSLDAPLGDSSSLDAPALATPPRSTPLVLRAPYDVSSLGLGGGGGGGEHRLVLVELPATNRADFGASLREIGASALERSMLFVKMYGSFF